MKDFTTEEYIQNAIKTLASNNAPAYKRQYIGTIEEIDYVCRMLGDGLTDEDRNDLKDKGHIKKHSIIFIKDFPLPRY